MINEHKREIMETIEELEKRLQEYRDKKNELPSYNELIELVKEIKISNAEITHTINNLDKRLKVLEEVQQRYIFSYKHPLKDLVSGNQADARPGSTKLRHKIEKWCCDEY